MSCSEKITIDGTVYVRETTLPEGNRAIVVVDRGWIFAGDVQVEENGSITLTNALHVLRWETVGFAGLVEDPKKAKAVLKTVPTSVQIPVASVIFTVPVSDTWG